MISCSAFAAQNPACIQRVLETLFYNPTTAGVHLALEDQIPDELVHELKPHWMILERRAQEMQVSEIFLSKGKGLNPEQALQYKNVQTARMSLSTTIVGKSEKNSEALLATRNWEKAEGKMNRWIRQKKPITLKGLFELNRTLGEGLHFNGHEPGTVRTIDVGIGGTIDDSYQFQNALDPKDIEKSLILYEHWLQEVNHTLDPIQLATEAYQRLNTIHPFQDGNGRTTRFLLDWVLLSHGLPPATFADVASTHIVIFPKDPFHKNPAPGTALKLVTDAVERTLSSFDVPAGAELTH